MSATAHEGTARRCAFCGAPADSGEHILPEWLQDVFPSDEPAVHTRLIGLDESKKTKWQRRPFREKVYVVCEACNTGWMSDLEKASKPLLVPPITKVPVAFDGPAQRIVATWALKTCLVLQASQMDTPIAAPALFAYLRAHRAPPPQVTVWLASHYRARHDPLNSIWIQRPLSLAEPADPNLTPVHGFGFLNFLAVGGIAFVVVGHRYRNAAEVTYDGSLDESLIKIWPPTGVVSWPPRYMLDRDLIDLLTVAPNGITIRVWPAS